MILILELLIVGITTAILGHTFYKLNNNKERKDYMLDFAFFITGVVIHMILDFIGFNKLYCDKRCIVATKVLNF